MINKILMAAWLLAVLGSFVALFYSHQSVEDLAPVYPQVRYDYYV